jgi:5,10-methylenetetrahydromethanopterin reductase
VAALEQYVRVVRAYLRGDALPFDDVNALAPEGRDIGTLGLADAPTDSRLAWLPRDLPPVPVEVAATGPKVLGVAARTADRVLLAVGADLERVRWAKEVIGPDGPPLGAFVNVVAHPDRDVARDLIAGGLASFARFSVMHGTVTGPADPDQHAVFDRVHDAYDMTRHTQSGTPQSAQLTDDFIDRFGIAGPPDECVERLLALHAAGIDRFVVVGPSIGSDRAEFAKAHATLAADVLPAIRERRN